MPFGRPTSYNPDFCERVVELGKEGKSITQIACALEVSKQSLYTWMEEHPDFLDAMTRARQESQNWWEAMGQMGLTADKFQASLWAKQVSCRFPDDYREQKDINLGGQKDGVPVRTDNKITVEFISADPKGV